MEKERKFTEKDRKVALRALAVDFVIGYNWYRMPITFGQLYRHKTLVDRKGNIKIN